jgi:hypothetical protein
LRRQVNGNPQQAHNLCGNSDFFRIFMAVADVMGASNGWLEGKDGSQSGD